ncbi:MAG: Gfo/Idh/MocA family oxidoreductase [Bryobacterales bacterium]|nr:Gfo/Idh/MocA family oxidoreductase [Bryobacterales bacterium]
MTEQIRTGIVGYGLGARVFHAPFLAALDEFQITHFVQRSSNTAASAYPGARIVRSVEELVNLPDVDLVVITTSNSTHFSLAKLALEAGKHVIVDKPMCETLAQAEQLLQTARASGKVFSVYQNRRWDGDYRTVCEVVRQGLLGDVHEFESHFDRYRPQLKKGSWKEEPGPATGMLFDLGSHLIDQALALFGNPRRIFADLRTQRPDSRIDDNFEVILDYGPLKATLKCGTMVREKPPRFQVLGARGAFVKWGMDPQEARLLKAEMPRWYPGLGDDPEENWGLLHTDIGGLVYRGKIETVAGDYAGYYRNVAAAIRGREELAVRPEQVLTLMKVLELARVSSREGRWMAFDA